MPDLVLTDLMIDGCRNAGLRLCQKVRQTSFQTPIVFFTNIDREADKIAAFRAGADGYLLSTIGVNYSLARIESLLIRADNIRCQCNNAETKLKTFSDLLIDMQVNRVKWKNIPLNLTETQYRILKQLVINVGLGQSHYDLMTEAKIVVQPNTIASHVKAMRHVFRLIDRNFSSIETVYGKGYRWIDAV